MVKNVLLSHRKTFSRKLQELFLTWYLEQELTKERIMEIYLNVIEFGPSIYGVGAAARHYFGKHPSQINPLEAAFFASILPSPKRRYIQYCRGQPSDRWDRYVRRILRRMASKKHISATELAAVENERLVFARDLDELSEKDCTRQLKELLDDWGKENIRRLKDAILRAAPHQVDLHVKE
jgi:membrane peptidoglycan carboxypeptidase